MEDSEKLTALKRAYADIILNTAKEAAARILASEKKALRFQRELFSTKEEALHMLLRLKHMLDSKVNEAESMSLSKQRRIEELEAQLQEAEDIVRDLREELSEAQDQLEKARNNQAQALDDPNLEADTTAHENGASITNDQTQDLHEQSLGGEFPSHKNGIHGPKSTSSVPSSQLNSSTNSGRNSVLNGKFDSSRCYSANDSHKDHCHNDEPGFSSLVVSRKEPELYKNGCTHRIRAIERNSLDRNLSVSELVGDVKNGAFDGREEKGERKHMKSTSKAENDEPQENPNKVKVSHTDYSHILEFPFKSFWRKRKRAARYKKDNATSCMKLPCDRVIGSLQEVPVLTCSNMSPHAVDYENRLENCSKKTTDENSKVPLSTSSPKLPLDRTEMSAQSGSANATGSNLEFIKPCSLQNANNVKLSLNKSALTIQESLVPELEVLACKTDVKKDNESEGRLDAKASDAGDGVSNHPASNNRFLKYTFCRKRKREPLSSPVDNSILKRKMGEKQEVSLEPQKPTLSTESPRDSRRLAQVARQLLSLSEKKW